MKRLLTVMAILVLAFTCWGLTPDFCIAISETAEQGKEEADMANINQIYMGGTAYDIEDAAARQELNDLKSETDASLEWLAEMITEGGNLINPYEIRPFYPSVTVEPSPDGARIYTAADQTWARGVADVALTPGETYTLSCKKSHTVGDGLGVMYSVVGSEAASVTLIAASAADDTLLKKSFTVPSDCEGTIRFHFFSNLSGTAAPSDAAVYELMLQKGEYKAPFFPFSTVKDESVQAELEKRLIFSGLYTSGSFNDAPDDQMVYVSTPDAGQYSNFPEGSPSHRGYLYTMHYKRDENMEIRHQVFIPTTNNAMFARTYLNGTWYAWQRIKDNTALHNSIADTTVYCLGDSITQLRYGTTYAYGVSWANQLADRSSVKQVINLGRNGFRWTDFSSGGVNTTKEYSEAAFKAENPACSWDSISVASANRLTRLSSNNNNFADGTLPTAASANYGSMSNVLRFMNRLTSELEYPMPDLIVIAMGTNDWNVTPDFTLEAFQAALEKTYDTMTAGDLISFPNAIQYALTWLKHQYPSARIMLGTAIPRCDIAGATAAVPKINRWLKEFAAYHDIEVIDMYNGGITQDNCSMYLVDNLHPGFKGCDIMARFYANAIKQSILLNDN